MTNYQQRATTVRAKYPYYDWCCKNVKDFKNRDGNIAFRRKVLELAKNNRKVQEELWILCSRDMLFWLNVFGMTYDPRLLPNSAVIPFITYSYQDIALDEVVEAIEAGFDELTEKSRDMGASWMYLTVFTYMFCFRDWCAFRMLSRKEDLVDKTEDPDCLFWKVMFLIEWMPKWLQPTYNKTHLHLKNYDNHSTIDGCSTTGDAARGGRCTAMLIDEFASVPDDSALLSSTRDVTKCRLFNSTHKGAGKAFYRLSLGTIRKLILHWSKHPVKQRGLYYSVDGKLVLLDKNFKGEVSVGDKKYMFPDDYAFRLDGKLRSPWYDNECDRAEHPMEIAQELDMDPFASDFQYFDGNMINAIEKADVRVPFAEGMLDFDEDSLDPLEFAPGKNGPLRLWINLDPYGKLPEDLDVVAGSDVSAGTGASNSTLSFVNKQTGEKIAEYVDPWIKPESFAEVATAFCRWFNNAYLIFDGAGTGRIFGDTIIKLYFNIYYRRNEEGYRKKVSDKPGVFLNTKEKAATLGQYRRSLKDKTFLQRSSIANQECLCYIHKGKTIEHTKAVNSVDPSGAGDNHGDLVIADALAAKGLYLFGANKLSTEPNVSKPDNCVASRREEYERKQKKESEW